MPAKKTPVLEQMESEKKKTASKKSCPKQNVKQSCGKCVQIKKMLKDVEIPVPKIKTVDETQAPIDTVIDIAPECDPFGCPENKF
jgi:hypothetical protein